MRVHHTSFVQDTVNYALQIKLFKKVDWQVYIAWVGLMLGLLLSTLGFVWFGVANGAPIPSYAWNVPIGVFIFAVAISFDTIGHRTTYAEELKRGEQLVHHITIFAGITSCLLLSACYNYPEFLEIPALVMVGMSIIYSLIDEALHWNRYMRGVSDRVEMWSHFFIFLGHFIFVLTWSKWYMTGYAGVPETLAAMREAGLIFF